MLEGDVFQVSPLDSSLRDGHALLDKPTQHATWGTCILYNGGFSWIARCMEAEQLNQIANRLNDLSARNLALRGYLWLRK